MKKTILSALMASFFLASCGGGENSIGKDMSKQEEIMGSVSMVGSVADSSVRVYRIKDLKEMGSGTTVSFTGDNLKEDDAYDVGDTEKVNYAGSFLTKIRVPVNMDESELVLVVSEGGIDINPFAGTEINPSSFASIKGTMSAVTTLKELRSGAVVVNPISTIANIETGVSASASAIDTARLKGELSKLSKYLLTNKKKSTGELGDINADGVIDFKDIALIDLIKVDQDYNNVVNDVISSPILYSELRKQGGLLELFINSPFDRANYKLNLKPFFPDNEKGEGDGINDLFQDKIAQDNAIETLINLLISGTPSINIETAQLNFFTRSLIAFEPFQSFYEESLKKVTKSSSQDDLRDKVRASILDVNHKIASLMKLKESPEDVKVEDFDIMGLTGVSENNILAVTEHLTSLNGFSQFSEIQSEINNLALWAVNAPVFTSVENVEYDISSTSNLVLIATAVESDIADSVIYTLAQSKPNLFTIDASTGAISFINNPIYKTFAKGHANPNNYNLEVLATDKAGNKSTQPLSVKVVRNQSILNTVNNAIDSDVMDFNYADFVGAELFQESDEYLSFLKSVLLARNEHVNNYKELEDIFHSIGKVFLIAGGDDSVPPMTAEELVALGIVVTEENLLALNSSISGMQGHISYAGLAELANSSTTLIQGSAVLGSISGGTVYITRLSDGVSMLDIPLTTIEFSNDMIQNSEGLKTVGNFSGYINVPIGMADSDLVLITVRGGIDINPNDDATVLPNEAKPLNGDMYAITSLGELKQGKVVVSALSTLAKIVVSQPQYQQSMSGIKDNLTKIANYLLSDEPFFMHTKGDMNFDGSLDFKDLAMYDARNINSETGGREDDSSLSSKFVYPKILFNNRHQMFIGQSFVTSILDDVAGSVSQANQANGLFSDSDGVNGIDLLQADNSNLIGATRNYLSLMMNDPVLGDLAVDDINLFMGKFIASEFFKGYYSQKIRECSFADNSHITPGELISCIKSANLTVDLFDQVANGAGTVDEFSTLGVVGVTEENLPYVLIEINKMASIKSVIQIQQVVDNVLSWAVNTPVPTSVDAVDFVAGGTGVVYTTTSLDADMNDITIYTISSEDGFKGNHFSINEVTGELRFKSPPIYHDPLINGNANNIYNVQIFATDRAGNKGIKEVVITVIE